ncbi:MAG: hypothetical protein EBT93_04455 [Alphaproteobacteria bacterium]|nr:hypothetical protein [Alphaproteobacteria bacterium]
MGRKLAWILLGLGKCQTFEAIDMLTRYMQFMVGHDSLVVPPPQLADVSIASLVQNFVSNLTINKTWHADCRKSAVSKILDWLVQ